jgi:hypothetical protein
MLGWALISREFQDPTRFALAAGRAFTLAARLSLPLIVAGMIESNISPPLLCVKLAIGLHTESLLYSYLLLS